LFIEKRSLYLCYLTHQQIPATATKDVPEVIRSDRRLLHDMPKAAAFEKLRAAFVSGFSQQLTREQNSPSTLVD